MTKKELEKLFTVTFLKGTCFDTLEELEKDSTDVRANAPRALIACELHGKWTGMRFMNKILEERKRGEEKTQVICAFTDCVHNKVKGMKYVCQLHEISISFHSNAVDESPTWLTECDMHEIREGYSGYKEKK